MKKRFAIFITFITVFFGAGLNAEHVSFCRNGLNILIPQQGTSAPDSVYVNLPPWQVVTDVNVFIDTVLHTWDSDLRFYLRKSEVGVKFINNVGGSDDNFIGTLLDDSATIPIVSGLAPFTGTYKPSFRLSVFNGISPQGYWLLQITDTIAGDSGRLKAWCIRVETQTPTGGIETVEIPNSFRLYQNYPNPFNPSTKIKYGLPKASHVKITVYDITGREIKILVDEFKSGGMYETDFNAIELPSGAYFYKFETSEFTSTKKMLLLK